MAERVVYEMTISHADFFRTLPAVMGETPYTVEGNAVTAKWSGGTVEIALSPEGKRSFGPIPLPVTHVEMLFRGLGEEKARDFLARFDNYYRRGGG